MMRNRPLSIVIPTIGSHALLDRAIESALECAPSFTREVVVSVNGVETPVTKNSRFRASQQVRWQFSNQQVEEHWISYNTAVHAANGQWVLLLSDDDFLVSTLETELQSFPWDNRGALFATHILIRNSESGESREGKRPPSFLQEHDVLRAHFDNLFHHHLSLFVFSASLFSEVRGYVPNLYPNGLFVDAVFHGWLCSRAQLVLGASKPVLVRQEGPAQSSAVFRIGKEVNDLMMSVVEAFVLDETFAFGVTERFGSIQKFYETLLVQRFGTEWGKLGNPIYAKGPKERVKLLLSFLLQWKVPPKRKLRYLLIRFKVFRFFPRLNHLMLQSLR